jgi:hypothetical protein
VLYRLTVRQQKSGSSPVVAVPASAAVDRVIVVCLKVALAVDVEKAVVVTVVLKSAANPVVPHNVAQALAQAVLAAASLMLPDVRSPVLQLEFDTRRPLALCRKNVMIHRRCPL